MSYLIAILPLVVVKGIIFLFFFLFLISFRLLCPTLKVTGILTAENSSAKHCSFLFGKNSSKKEFKSQHNMKYQRVGTWKVATIPEKEKYALGINSKCALWCKKLKIVPPSSHLPSLSVLHYCQDDPGTMQQAALTKE